jgi:hypothetical protein
MNGKYPKIGIPNGPREHCIVGFYSVGVGTAFYENIG